MPLTKDIIEAAPNLAADVVREWAAMNGSQWPRPSEPIDANDLVALIRRLGEAALTREGERGKPTRDLIRVAIQHGRERRADGFTEEMLFREYHLLRRGLWSELKQTNPELASETIIRIDAEISMATCASLRGFHSLPDLAGDEMLVEEIARNWQA